VEDVGGFKELANGTPAARGNTHCANDILKRELSCAGLHYHLCPPRFVRSPTPPIPFLSPQHTVTLSAIQCAVDGCVVPPLVVRPSTYSLWSSPTTWPSGVVPKAGDDVVIAGNMAVLMDVNPVLGALRVDGALRFLDDADRELHAGA
jgi:hypothetical protein